MRAFILTVGLCAFVAIASSAQYTYSSSNNEQAKACFKGFCETDTLKLSALKKLRSLPLVTDNKELKLAEFTIMLTDVNDMVYIAVIKFDYLDRNNIDLLSRSYKTIQLTDILAKDKEGHLVKLKPRLYRIIE